MSLEPKKPIEELLEASARARRAQFGADPKMPNPMRAHLHAEVTRLARGHEREEPRFRIFWPRLMAGAAFALLLVSVSGIWWWRQHQPTGGETIKLAMQQPMAPANEAVAPDKVFEQGAAAAAAPAAQNFAENNAAPSGPAGEVKDGDTLRRFAETRNAPAAMMPTPEGLITAAKKADQPVLAEKSLATKEPSSAAAPARDSLAQNGQMTNFRQQSSQNTDNQALRGKLKQGLNILNEFQVEQTDHEIRLVDADGSTYSGKLERLAQNDPRSVFNQKQNYTAPASRGASSFDDKSQSTNAEFYFRATGYNSSLKKPLVFEGNYIASFLLQKKIAKAKAEAEERDEQSPARITGIAKVRGESPVQIDAVAVGQ